MDGVENLYRQIVDKYTGIRRIEICANRVKVESYLQYNLFMDMEAVEKEKNLQKAVLSVQKRYGNNININLGKVDAVLAESEQVRGEILKTNDRIKVYVTEVKNSTKGPRINVSRSHPDLVKRLFEAGVRLRDCTL